MCQTLSTWFEFAPAASSEGIGRCDTLVLPTMADAAGWDSDEGEQQATQEQGGLTADTDSDDDGGSQTAGSEAQAQDAKFSHPLGCPAALWAAPLREVCQKYFDERGAQTRPLTHVSLCTGMFSERKVFEVSSFCICSVESWCCSVSMHAPAHVHNTLNGMSVCVCNLVGMVASYIKGAAYLYTAFAFVELHIFQACMQYARAFSCAMYVHAYMCIGVCAHMHMRM